MAAPIRMGKNMVFLQIYPSMSSAKLLTAVLFPDELVMVFLPMLCYKRVPEGFMGSAEAAYKRLREEDKLA